jgi:hypothetical protein
MATKDLMEEKTIRRYLRGASMTALSSPLPLWERVVSIVRCEPGEGFAASLYSSPLTRFLAALETTLSHKGRGKVQP